MLCSIIIPVYNHAALTQQCLNCLLSNPAKRVVQEIIVVDDASYDQTPQLLARYGDKIRVIRHTANQGFASTCNDGAAEASGDLLVFLNNDTIPMVGWLDALVDYVHQHPEAAIVGSRLLYSDGTIQHAGVVIGQDRLPRHLYAGFFGDHPAVMKSRRVRSVTGACMFMRRELFQAMNGFDTGFTNGLEDVDLCLRVNGTGLEIHYCHASILYHLESPTRGHDLLDNQANVALYRERWGQLLPDDLQYYVNDGLLRFDYQFLYPFNIWIDPQLATVRKEERDHDVERILMRRTHQIESLQREHSQLTGQILGLESTRRPQSNPLEDTKASLSLGERRPVDIIVPNYNSLEYLQPMLDSVIAHTDLTYHTLTVIDDSSPDARVRDYLYTLYQTTPLQIRILFNPQNLGFLRTANCGLRLSQGDVVLMNPDTIATAHWLEKLQRAAYSNSRIASVTPFSNNATIFSVPNFCEANAVPAGYTIDSFAALIERIALYHYPQVPTAHGFCMYIKRTALDTVGHFDEAHFSPMYAEENDWCMRAYKQGYSHILDDATYIYHHGTVTSSSEVRERLNQQHLVILDQLHPEYIPMVADFCSRNPLSPLHDNIRRNL